MKVLIVEDSLTAINYLRHILLKNIQDIDIDYVNDGKKAYNILSKRKYDIIFLDWNMPNMNGYDLLLEMKNLLINKDTPIMMVTTEGNRTEIVSAIKMGIKGYVVKPYTEEYIMQQIYNLILEL